MDETLAPRIQLKILRATETSLPPLVLQVTQMVDTYMLWIGVADANIHINGSNKEEVVLNGNLCKDWACAMPPRSSGAPAAATSLFRSSSTDVALPMAQRLAKRFQKQIFLSVDIPAGFASMGQGDQLAYEVEKGIVTTLKEIESEEKAATGE